MELSSCPDHSLPRKGRSNLNLNRLLESQTPDWRKLREDLPFHYKTGKILHYLRIIKFIHFCTFLRLVLNFGVKAQHNSLISSSLSLIHVSRQEKFALNLKTLKRKTVHSIYKVQNTVNTTELLQSSSGLSGGFIPHVSLLIRISATGSYGSNGAKR